MIEIYQKRKKLKSILGLYLPLLKWKYGKETKENAYYVVLPKIYIMTTIFHFLKVAQVLVQKI